MSLSVAAAPPPPSPGPAPSPCEREFDTASFFGGLILGIGLLGGYILIARYCGSRERGAYSRIDETRTEAAPISSTA